MEFFVFFVILAIVIPLARQKAKKEHAEREAAFEIVMRSLEEKAKREGTFVISYFDKPEKK